MTSIGSVLKVEYDLIYISNNLNKKKANLHLSNVKSES